MKRRFLFYICLIMLLLVFKFGRGLWYPVYLKISDKMTEEERVIELKNKVVSTINLSELGSINLLALKEERILELWGKQKGMWELLKTYPFTAFSGKLGPKLLEGDFQIPEGLYGIEYLNPNSSYHLSMKISYPNDFDKAMAKKDGRENLGGDIFIHGKDVTIGCIPIGDEAIEELFYLVSQVGKSRVKVLILPYDFRKGKYDLAIDTVDWEKRLYRKLDFELKSFWK